MALSRRTGARLQGNIWPGFVDAMTGLLLVLMFVLTIFMVVQAILRETITGQENELNTLSGEIAALAEALGLERNRNADLQSELGSLNATLDDTRSELASQRALIASLTETRDAQADQIAEAQARITSFEAQVAALIADRDDAQARIADLTATREELEAARDELLTEQEALNLALLSARGEIDAQAEAARLAAAQAEAMEALVADLRAKNAEQEAEALALSQQSEDLADQLSAEEARRLAEAEAAAALRARLENADAELTAMTLALERQRAEAEETLTLLAAARDAQEDLDERLAAALLDNQTAQAALEDVRSERADLAAELQNASETGDDLQSRLDQAVATGQDLIARLDAVDAERKAALARVAELEAQVRVLTRETEEVALTEEEIRAELAAALAEKLAAERALEDQMSEAAVREALLATASSELEQEQTRASAAQRQTEVLNQQVAELRKQLVSLQSLLDASQAQDEAAQVQLQNLGSQLNTALARAAAEERRRRQLEEEERKRLEAEAADLKNYRSEFFGRLREVLGNQEGVRIEGDRFVFSSEVLFAPGEAVLSSQGRQEVAKVAAILRRVSSEIPPEIDWIIRVDGHTDDTPLSGFGEFADNWELSQARALSVVRFMTEFLGIPPNRLAANGFGEFQPVNTADTDAARAQNRRIELKLTER